MYSPHLDTPPPQSQFRRPWSPDPHDPLPTIHLGGFNQDRDSRLLSQNYDYDYPPQSRLVYQQRREPSDVSVEALDLADYAMTLRPNRTHENDQHYSNEMYPLSRDSMAPPSLTSHGETLSSMSHSTRSAYPSRRPFSLPPQSSSSTHPTSGLSHRYPTFGNPRIPSPRIQTNTDSDIDVSQFPAWSRNWYNTNTLSPPDDIYTALPKSNFGSKHSPFDPGNAHKYRSDDLDPFNSYTAMPSYGRESSRDIVPWSSDPPEYGPIDASLKEERIRMLEREFGPNSRTKGRNNDPFLDDVGKPLVGTVDAKGQLVTQGPKKRLVLRILQIILALAAAIPGIYAAVVCLDLSPKFIKLITPR